VLQTGVMAALETAREAIAILQGAGVTLSPGLTHDEFARIKRRQGFEFAEVHRIFLSMNLPLGKRWPDWRSEDTEATQSRLDWPIEGIVFDVLTNAFWLAAWGERPLDKGVAEQVARAHLALTPKMVPIYGHRYLPAGPRPLDRPVFSIYQTDVIYYGADLVDYVANEFARRNPAPSAASPSCRVDFWLDLVDEG